MYQVGQCSPKAAAQIVDYTDKVGTTQASRTPKYPFEGMLIGQAFAVEHSELVEASLRSIAFLKGKKLGKKFAVIKHETVYEVARIA